MKDGIGSVGDQRPFDALRKRRSMSCVSFSRSSVRGSTTVKPRTLS